MRTPDREGEGPGNPGARARGARPHDTVELVEQPGLGVLYVQGVARSGARAAVAAVRRRRSVRVGDLPGTELVVREVRPDAAHLTAYQHLVGEAVTDTLPAGFVHVLAFPAATALMVRGDFPLPLLGMVHVANRVEQRRPLALGDVLDVRVRAEHLRPHRAGVTVDLVAEVATDGDVAWRGTSTYLAKGYRLEGGDRAPLRDRPAWEPPVPTAQWRLGADVGRRYAAVSGDRNPIHTSRAAARAFGFPRTIAHGMYTAARALAEVGRLRGESFVWDVEFAKPVLLPSTVSVRIAARGDQARAGGVRSGEHGASGADYAVWSPRSGTVHLTGSVTPEA